MSVAVFYPCHPYSDEYSKKDIVSNNIEVLYPVLNYPTEILDHSSQDLFNEKREEFLRLLSDPSIESLMVWRGGRIDDDKRLWKTSFGLLKALTENDWKKIKSCTKNIIGYSDATYLLCALVSHGINCFYGPNYNTTLQCSTDVELNTTLEYLYQALDAKTDYTVNFNAKRLTAEENLPWTLSGGTTTGRLIGGNLDTIYTLLNNEQPNIFSPQKGDILLLEECEPCYMYSDLSEVVSMREKLAVLNDAGVFSKIGGLLFGRSKTPIVHNLDNGIYYEQVDNSLEKKHFEECIRSVVSDDIPILANVACGHTHPMVTLPLGKTVTLDSDEQTLTVHF